MLLGFTVDELVEKGGDKTAMEICQQPRLWMETCEIMKKHAGEISDYLTRMQGNGIKRVVLTGAGSSAFVGEVLVPYLNSKFVNKVEAIATTDIVSNPENYLYRDVPTLLVSFARSGNSPESVAVVELAEKMVNDLYQITITCNPNGKLAERASNNEKNLLILMPRDSNDQGFAMTGSFTCMVLAGILLFDIEGIDKNIEDIKHVFEAAEDILVEKADLMNELAKIDYDRVVFLGSSILKGIAKEASLKVLELTGGNVAAFYNSSLGFRHGPKSVISGNTIIFSLLSDDTYTRKYEVDLLRELRNDEGEKIAVTFTSSYDTEIENLVDYIVAMDIEPRKQFDDIYLAFLYILTAQIFAFYRSLELRISPDDPSPNGRVNRVVKGVEIYNYR